MAFLRALRTDIFAVSPARAASFATLVFGA
jgi:hypothetical protein